MKSLLWGLLGTNRRVKRSGYSNNLSDSRDNDRAGLELLSPRVRNRGRPNDPSGEEGSISFHCLIAQRKDFNFTFLITNLEYSPRA
ncbi:hypothetical protein Nepgr_024453 [Nepenthes gracilis]|uniref:Uncharacterized protein n=1 Tax=Nepenthes gracilis TaxID=150966 RepID=A0AAD3T344_NEPGR|nr:hypothetical protein Nepgr_024453 [Nepenthes gracilis]